MRTIYKYRLMDERGLVQEEHVMPAGAKILMVGAQGRTVNVWILVDPSVGYVRNRRFVVVGTGHQVPEGLSERDYIGTVVWDGNPSYVWHVFERRQ